MAAAVWVVFLAAKAWAGGQSSWEQGPPGALSRHGSVEISGCQGQGAALRLVLGCLPPAWGCYPLVPGSSCPRKIRSPGLLHVC